jgi:hypothetical protein
MKLHPASCISVFASVTTLVAATAILGGCGTMGVGGNPGPPVPAPDHRVGDRWTYHGELGFRTKVVWDETHEITSIGPDGIKVQVSTVERGQTTVRTETWQAPGVVLAGSVLDEGTRRFDPALLRYRYPLATGESWQQRIRDLDRPINPFGPILRQVTVGGYESVTTPAGTFDAITMRVVLTLDDETAFRTATQCTGTIRYSPPAAAAARTEYSCWYREKGDQSRVNLPGPNPVLELTSYRRGP